MALWGLMWWTTLLSEDYIWIVGDSKVLIDHLNHKEKINPRYLSHWLCRIENLKFDFAGISFNHIFREKNTVADDLSKQGLKAIYGKIYYQFHNGQGLQAEGSVDII